MLIQIQPQRAFQTYDDSKNSRPTPDKNILDPNENFVWKAASNLGLVNKEAREDLFKRGLEGSLTEYETQLIKEIQKGLKDDGKYNGEIDGLFGSKSTKALKNLIEENKVFRNAKRSIGDFEIELGGELPFDDLNNLGKPEESNREDFQINPKNQNFKK